MYDLANESNTVNSLNNGHFGTWPFVLSLVLYKWVPNLCVTSFSSDVTYRTVLLLNLP